jgi:enoyl-CoA hydratase
VSDSEACRVDVDGLVATVTVIPPSRLTGKTRDLHWDLGQVFSDLRGNNSIRVIVVTGMGDEFYAPDTKGLLSSDIFRNYLCEPSGAYRTFTGVLRCHQCMAEIEKPIVAKVNGNAIGFGASIVFACDLIIATQDAVFSDAHLSMGELKEGGTNHGLAPGDGGGALVPLFMSPAKAKEYLMLSKTYTALELANLGVINYAVPSGELDTVTDEIVAKLLSRSAYALAWTKRIANRRVVNALNMSLDASVAYEMVGLLQIERSEWHDPFTLE